MRDPKRIRAFCNRLAESWELWPDLRFGQLIINVFGSMDRDSYYTEDEEMIRAIEQYVNVYNPYYRRKKVGKDDRAREDDGRATKEMKKNG